MTTKVFELYSGIGGMRLALQESGINADVIRAIDINTTANTVYKENFGKEVLLEKNIQGLTEDDFNKFGIDMILMSPPCQPHTRNGLQKDKSDERSDSLLHIISLIPKLNTLKYLLLENVKGFEISEIRDDLIEVLKECNFVFQEFLLSPNQFCIPNSRLRYYLLAKKQPLNFIFDVQNDIINELSILGSEIISIISKLNLKFKKYKSESSCFEIEHILEKEGELVSEKLIEKYGMLFDIVTSKSTRSCCFTKGYGHFVEGTGSVFSSKDLSYLEKVLFKLKSVPQKSKESLNLLKSLDLRYFTPKEICNLMCFPDTFKFPNSLSTKQKYRLLGNSINVHVVSILIKILVS